MKKFNLLSFIVMLGLIATHAIAQESSGDLSTEESAIVEAPTEDAVASELAPVVETEVTGEVILGCQGDCGCAANSAMSVQYGTPMATSYGSYNGCGTSAVIYNQPTCTSTPVTSCCRPNRWVWNRRVSNRCGCRCVSRGCVTAAPVSYQAATNCGCAQPVASRCGGCTSYGTQVAYQTYPTSQVETASYEVMGCNSGCGSAVNYTYSTDGVMISGAPIQGCSGAGCGGTVVYETTEATSEVVDVPVEAPTVDSEAPAVEPEATDAPAEETDADDKEA